MLRLRASSTFRAAYSSLIHGTSSWRKVWRRDAATTAAGTAALLDFDLLDYQCLVRFVASLQFEGVGEDRLALLDAGDHVRAADPMGFFVIGLRPLRGMIRVRMVEADDVFSAV